MGLKSFFYLMRPFIIFLSFLFSFQFLFSQPPQGFNYQSVVRNTTGAILANQNVRFRISILQTTVSGSVQYAESHQNTTTAQGISSFVIGTGTVISGNFSGINWGADSYFLKVELDGTGGTNYLPMSTTQLVSVPYALYAKTALNSESDHDRDSTNELQNLTFNSGLLSLSNGNAVNIPDSVIDDDADSTNELQNLLFNAGNLSLTNGNSVFIPDSVIDDDADSTNELQNLAFAGGMLSISNGNSVSIPDSVIDDDADSTNELQNLAFAGGMLSISNGNSVSIPDSVNDADANPTNELQLISLSVDTIQLNQGGGSVIIPGARSLKAYGSATVLPGTTDMVSLAVKANRLVHISGTAYRASGAGAFMNVIFADGSNVPINVDLKRNYILYNTSTLTNQPNVDMVQTSNFQVGSATPNVDSYMSFDAWYLPATNMTLKIRANGNGTFNAVILQY